MKDQLVLLEDQLTGPEGQDAEVRATPWRIDEHTREVGRRGVALAREALRQAAVRAA